MNGRAPEILVKNKLHHGELFKISRFKEVIKKTSPHKHDGYYELIFIREGEGFHWIDTESFRLAAPEIYFMKPGQLHCWQFTSIPKGYVILFREEFFDPIREIYILELIKRFKDTVRIPVVNGYNPEFLFQELFAEYLSASSYSTNIIHGYLRVIFSKILQLADTLEEQTNHPASLHQRFLKLLSERSPELRSVSEFSVLLNTSPQNLNNACRKFTDKSAGGHIAIQLLLEAKRYILHTDLTVNEIAHQLNFNDASYFVKFFKKQEGITPLQFRERHFQ
jgi:AraC-like DNA-binding protein